MGFTPRDSVVDRWCRSWDVPNLFVCDGSVLPTQGSANPALTISALAARTADWLRRAIPRGEPCIPPGCSEGGRMTARHVPISPPIIPSERTP